MSETLNADTIRKWGERYSNWGRWGERDQLGALNWIGPEKRAAAAGLVRSGRAVSCARPLDTEPAPDNLRPATHHMTGTASEGVGADYFALAPTATPPPTSMRCATSSTRTGSTTATRPRPSPRTAPSSSASTRCATA